MNAKLIVAFLVIFAVGVGLYFFSPKADAPTVESGESSEQTTEESPENTVVGDTSNPLDAPSQSTQTKPQTATPTPPPTTYTPPATQSNSLPYSATVIYDGGRFIPDEVTIIVGGTVRFVNRSDEEKMWIAGDNHPTHNTYPIKTDIGCGPTIFNQCAAVGRNGSWSFRFDRWGGWGYHNEERAKDDGYIRVLTVEDYEKQI